MKSIRREPHGIPYNKVCDSLSQKIFQKAYREFVELVGPREDLSEVETGGLQSAGIEWFVFDHHLADGRSPLQYCIEEKGDKLNSRTRRVFRQSLESHFCGHFNITGLDRSRCSIQLTNPSDGKVYTTYDVSLSNSLRGPFGVIGTRLVQIDGEWQYPGIPVYCINNDADQEEKDRLSAAFPENLTFLDLVRFMYRAQ